MGVSANEFWMNSKNGKAMVVMLARRGDVELVRDILDWLVGMLRKSFKESAAKNGASEEQAKSFAANQTSSIQGQVDNINDKNVEGASTYIIDQIFQREYNAGKQHYDKAMEQFANELRNRVKD